MNEERKQLCQAYVAMKEERDKLKAAATEIWNNMKEIERKLIEDMEDEDMSLFRDSTLGKTFYQIHDTNIKIVDKDMYYKWLNDNNMGDAVIKAINATNQKSLIKDHIERTGQDIPGVETSSYTKLGMRKS